MLPRSNLHVWYVWLVYILISLGSCALAYIIAFSYPYILMFVCACLYPRILTSAHPQVHVPSLASPYPQICVCLLVTLHFHTLRFMYSGCLQSSQPHILISLCSCTPGACWFPRILTSSYPYVHVLWVLVGILASTHPHMLKFQCLSLFRKLESDKSMVLTKKTAFMETNNGSNKFVTKKYIYNKNWLYHEKS